MKERIARVNNTINTAKAAFSKSVSCSSSGRNSTLHPISELGGGEGGNSDLLHVANIYLPQSGQSHSLHPVPPAQKTER